MPQGRSPDQRGGFTLVELLLAIVITGIVGGAAVSLFVVFFNHFEQTSEIVSARQRGEMVLAVLEGPVLQAGLGMPRGSSDFQSAFAGLSIAAWQAPLRVDDHGTGVDLASKGELKLAYAVPAKAVTVAEQTLDASGVVDVELNKPLDPDMIGTGASTVKGWALFPTARTPLRITAYDGSVPELTLKPLAGSALIARFDEMHYLRAFRAYVENDNFILNEVTLAGAQPFEGNIAAVHFDFDAASRFLTTTVLAAGEQARKFALYADEDEIPGWPSGVNVPQFMTKWRYRRLVAVSGSWRVRN
ncbi:MAG: prepilin-type N-terminal cleavage/methylation domain-containing protein [Synergistales bacterium]|nr:prepilin-type N-terminal cleavage/methylation domain-containing protein [Synergistales bacterium]